MIKHKKIFIPIFYCLLLILASIFFFFDLNISKVMVSDNPNFLYVLLDAIGEFPIYIGPIMFGLVYGLTSEVKWKKLSCHFVGLIGMYIGVTRLVEGIFECFLNARLGDMQNILLAVVSLLLYLFSFIFANKISEANLNKIKDIALMALIISVSSFLIVSGTKLLWGRPRYRVLSSDYNEYVNFLTIDGFKHGIPSSDYCSFPSGHTNAASSILIYGLIPSRFVRKNWVRYFVNILCVIYPLVVAISRIVVGAHFASDVLFGFGISFTCLLITYIIFEKKGWLYVRNN